MPDSPFDAHPISPMPVPAGAPLVILVGGTFDPPHLAHVKLPIRARDELERRAGCRGRGVLVFIPAVRSPLKDAGPVASDADRVAMLTLALAGRERTGVWTDEIDRAGRAAAPSYTFETLERGRRWLDTNGCASASMRLLIGADQALAFHRWREPRRIIALAEPAVMPRAPICSREQFLEAMRAGGGGWTNAEIADWGSRLLEIGAIEAAATSARRLLASAPSESAALAVLLDPRVLDYIKNRHLYAPAGSPPAAEPPLHPGPG